MFRMIFAAVSAVTLACAAAPASALPAHQAGAVKAAAESVEPVTEARHRRGHLRRSSGWHSRRGSYYRGYRPRYYYYPQPYYYYYPRTFYYPRPYYRSWGGPRRHWRRW